MEKQKKELNKQSKINIRLILSLLIGLTFFSAILLVTMYQAAGETKSTVKQKLGTYKKGEQNVESSQSAIKGSEMLAMVMDVQIKNQQITLFDIAKQETVVLSYTGGCDITDRYDRVIAISQISIGTIVDVEYQNELEKLLRLQISTKAWEYIGVNNLTIDRTARVMKIATSKYKYTDNVIVIDEVNFIPVANLTEQDTLTIRGYEETIWSITVTRGHGTVKLEDYEAFLGAHLTVGYEAMQQITEDMVITVREGNFNLTIENGKFSVAKNINIRRNQETIVSLGDIGPEAPKRSRVTFEISPLGADLFINGELVSYANPSELTYGEHAIKVSLGGYTTFQGTLNVNTAGKTINIDLPEISKGDEASISVTEENGSPATGGSEDTNLGDEEDYTIDEDHVLYVQNPIGASVYINGEFMGISPGGYKKMIGTHVITFIKEGHETKSYTIEVLDNGLDMYFSLPDLVQSE